MHSLRMCCKILCQNLVVHPKCMLGGSTKIHAFHVPPTPLPPPAPPPPWQFGFLAFLDSGSKVGCQPPPPTPEMGFRHHIDQLESSGGYKGRLPQRTKISLISCFCFRKSIKYMRPPPPRGWCPLLCQVLDPTMESTCKQFEMVYETQHTSSKEPFLVNSSCAANTGIGTRDMNATIQPTIIALSG